MAMQILLLNHISISTLFAPMVYIAILVMMPLDTPPIKMLLVGLALGFAADITMGTIGLNVLATLPVAMLRRPMLVHVANIADYKVANDLPTIKLLGQRRYFMYAAAMVVTHSLIYFFAEQMSLFNLQHFILRTLISTLTSVALVALLLRLFNTKFESQ